MILRQVQRVNPSNNHRTDVLEKSMFLDGLHENFHFRLSVEGVLLIVQHHLNVGADTASKRAQMIATL